MNRKKSALKKQFDFFFENQNKAKTKRKQILIQTIATDWIHLFIAKFQLNKNSHDFNEDFKRQRGGLRQ